MDQYLATAHCSIVLRLCFLYLLAAAILYGCSTDLVDAARIDGANELGIFVRIILPLVKPALAVIALFELLNRWGDFMGPLIFLNESRLYTISLGLQQYRSERSTEWAYLMAASTLVTLPVIIVFIFTQHTFIEGITLTGIKG